ncbi:MAG: hypothetical protein Q8N99_01880 [Nanoarchaeota archaeon]|nr:hypothetical protein [Nanoarchaeota archaeon]
MKIFKVEKTRKSKVTRKIIANFGEAIYQCPEIRSVQLKVYFKDGSSLGFNRDEDEDDFKSFFEGSEEEREKI